VRYQVGFAGAARRRVFVNLIAPEHPVALALVVHGAGSYLGPYLPFAWELASTGISVTLLDLPGHGLSDGTPAHTRSHTAYLEAIGEALDWARAACPAPSTFLIGESYGAVLALLYAVGHPDPSRQQSGGNPVSGLVLSAPAFRVAGVPGWALTAVRAMARVAPRLRLPRGAPLAVSRNPVAGEIVRRDPFLHRRLSTRYVAELVRAGEQAARRAPEVKVPVLFLISRTDLVVDNRSTREVFSRLGTDDRTWQEFGGLAHALLLEDPAGIAGLVSRWVQDRVCRTTHRPAQPSQA